MFKSIKLVCSINLYNIINSIAENENVFSCLFDLSYGDVKSKKKEFINCNENILCTDFFDKIDLNTNIELIYNSNNSCEYCNFLYIVAHLPLCNVSLLDLGQTIDTKFGKLTVSESGQLPENYLQRYEKKACQLTQDKRIIYQKEWEKIYSVNTDLRFIKDKKLISVGNDYFDKELGSKDIGHLMIEYGLSEQCLLHRNKKLGDK